MPTDINLPKKGMIYQREQYDKGGFSKKYWVHKDDKILNFIPDHFETLYDIGCGEGILLERITKLFPKKNIVGIDFEKENINICEKHKLNVFFGSVFDLPIKDNSAYCVIFMEVIEHLEKPEKALAEINRILKPGGQLILMFPNDLVFLFSRLNF